MRTPEQRLSDPGEASRLEGLVKTTAAPVLQDFKPVRTDLRRLERAFETEMRVESTERGEIRRVHFEEPATPIVARDFMDAVSLAGREIEARVNRRFGGEADGAKNEYALSKHAPEHSTEEVEVGTIAILSEINQTLIRAYGSEAAAAHDPAYSSQEQLALAGLMAKVHDSVQDGIIIKDPNGHRILQRYRGAMGADASEQVGDPATGKRSETVEREMEQFGIKGNERASADELVGHLKRYQNAQGEPIFSEEQMATIAPDIAATYPNFQFRPDTGLKVFQPYLDKTINPHMTMAGFALAHADLRFLLAQQTTERFFEGGDAELRETKPWIFEDMRSSLDQISAQEMQQAAKEIIGWVKTQIGFAEWQKKLMIQSLQEDANIAASPHAETIRAALAAQFQLGPGEAFDRNIAATVKRADEVARSFEDLTRVSHVDEHTRSHFLALLNTVSG